MDDKPQTVENGLGSLPLVQVILPVACAAFVALVVVVLACCLPRKRSGSVMKPSPRSIYSIDTSNDTSECGIYDIFSEVKSNTDRIVYNSHHFIDPKTSCSFAVPFNTTFCHNNRLEEAAGPTILYDGPHPDHMLDHVQAPFKVTKELGGLIENKTGDCRCVETDNPDGGHYETLTRHWKGKHSGNENTTSAHHSNSMGNSNPRKSRHESGSQNNEENEIANSNHLLCQLTVFAPPNNGSYSPSLSRTLCLYSIEGTAQEQENLLETLQNSKLLVIPKPTDSPVTPQRESSDIFLSPVNDEEKEIYRHLQSTGSTQALNLSLSSPYAKIKRRPPFASSTLSKLQLRRSSSFQEENKQHSDAQRVGKTHRRRRSDFIHSGKGNPAGLTAGELQEILTKLGPLPPLPSHGCRPSHSAMSLRTSSECSRKPTSIWETTANNIPSVKRENRVNSDVDEPKEPIYFELEDYAAFLDDSESDASQSSSDLSG